MLLLELANGLGSAVEHLGPAAPKLSGSSRLASDWVLENDAPMFVRIERARPVETLVANFERVSAGGGHTSLHQVPARAVATLIKALFPLRS